MSDLRKPSFIIYNLGGFRGEMPSPLVRWIFMIHHKCSNHFHDTFLVGGSFWALPPGGFEILIKNQSVAGIQPEHSNSPSRSFWKMFLPSRHTMQRAKWEHPRPHPPKRGPQCVITTLYLSSDPLFLFLLSWGTFHYIIHLSSHTRSLVSLIPLFSPLLPRRNQIRE